MKITREELANLTVRLSMTDPKQFKDFNQSSQTENENIMTDKTKAPPKKVPWVVKVHNNFSDNILQWMELLIFAVYVGDGLFIASLGTHLEISFTARAALHITQGLICVALSLGFFAFIRSASKINIEYKNYPKWAKTTVISSYIMAAILSAVGMFYGPYVLFELAASLSVGINPITGVPYPNGPSLVYDASMNCSMSIACWVETLSANELLVGPFVSMVFHYLITVVIWGASAKMILDLPFTSKSKELKPNEKPLKDNPPKPNKDKKPSGNSTGRKTPPPTPKI